MTMRLVAIGLTAGFFSALFGVGGGVIAVPLLLLATRLTERNAMATSLAAIAITAAVGAATYAWHGEVHVGYAALVGVPAAFGAVAGAALQQRIARRTLTLAFAALLVVVGVRLLI